jgi:hypothetical protein
MNLTFTPAITYLRDPVAAGRYCTERPKDWADLKNRLTFMLRGPETLRCAIYGLEIDLFLRNEPASIGHVRTCDGAIMRIVTLDQALAYILARFW